MQQDFWMSVWTHQAHFCQGSWTLQKQFDGNWNSCRDFPSPKRCWWICSFWFVQLRHGGWYVTLSVGSYSPRYCLRGASVCTSVTPSIEQKALVRVGRYLKGTMKSDNLSWLPPIPPTSIVTSTLILLVYTATRTHKTHTVLEVAQATSSLHLVARFSGSLRCRWRLLCQWWKPNMLRWALLAKIWFQSCRWWKN